MLSADLCSFLPILICHSVDRDSLCRLEVVVLAVVSLEMPCPDQAVLAEGHDRICIGHAHVNDFL